MPNVFNFFLESLEEPYKYLVIELKQKLTANQKNKHYARMQERRLQRISAYCSLNNNPDDNVTTKNPISTGRVTDGVNTFHTSFSIIDEHERWPSPPTCTIGQTCSELGHRDHKCKIQEDSGSLFEPGSESSAPGVSSVNTSSTNPLSDMLMISGNQILPGTPGEGTRSDNTSPTDPPSDTLMISGNQSLSGTPGEGTRSVNNSPTDPPSDTLMISWNQSLSGTPGEGTRSVNTCHTDTPSDTLMLSGNQTLSESPGEVTHQHTTMCIPRNGNSIGGESSNRPATRQNIPVKHEHRDSQNTQVDSHEADGLNRKGPETTKFNLPSQRSCEAGQSKCRLVMISDSFFS